MIPFQVQIPLDEQDRGLTEKLQRELPGILTWALHGCTLWREQGLQEPSEVQDATAAYRSDMDRIGGFINECCAEHPNAKLAVSALYAAYQQWSDNNAEEKASIKEFGHYLTQRGFDRYKGAAGKAMRAGIGLREDHRSPF